MCMQVFKRQTTPFPRPEDEFAFFFLVCHILECTGKQGAVERRIKANVTAPSASSRKISQLLRKALVTSPSLFFFLLSQVIIFTLFSSPMDQVMQPHPPCSDVTMSNKKQTGSKLQWHSSYTVVIDACAAFFLSAQERSIPALPSTPSATFLH